MQYDYQKILKQSRLNLNDQESEAIRNKFLYFVFLSPFESYSGVARYKTLGFQTSILKKIFTHVLLYWIAPNISYFDPEIQKNPINVVDDWCKNSDFSVLYSPTILDEVLGNETNHLFVEKLHQRNMVFELPHTGRHIKMQDISIKKHILQYLTGELFLPRL